jgi:hypothetical protein
MGNHGTGGVKFEVDGINERRRLEALTDGPITGGKIKACPRGQSMGINVLDVQQ